MSGILENNWFKKDSNFRYLNLKIFGNHMTWNLEEFIKTKFFKFDRGFQISQTCYRSLFGFGNFVMKYRWFFLIYFYFIFRFIDFCWNVTLVKLISREFYQWELFWWRIKLKFLKIVRLYHIISVLLLCFIIEWKINFYVMQANLSDTFRTFLGNYKQPRLSRNVENLASNRLPRPLGRILACN